MLQSRFKEGGTLRSQSGVEIRLPDDSADAFLIILNIIHYHHRKVPRRITFAQLTQIACLVDKYEMHESVELNTDIWVEDLEKSLPVSFDASLVPWLCIAWVFRKAAIFSDLTELALRLSEKPVETDELPIPSDLIGKTQLREEI